jgi:hypothetical protein
MESDMVDLLPSDVKGLDPVQEREEDNEEIFNTEVNLNGAKVKIKDLFPDIFEARNFARQVQLIDAARKAPKKDQAGQEIELE